MRIKAFLAFFLAGLLVSKVEGATIEVPGQQATIQAALDAATDGDVVLVAPGEYLLAQPLLFRGKAVALKSAEGPEKTILRATAPADPDRASLVAFEGAEPEGASLEGFTLADGRGTLKDVNFSLGRIVRARAGGAIFCGSHAAPRIVGNVFRGNQAEHGGAVLCDVDSSPELRDNSFLENQASGGPETDPGPRGGALTCLEDSTVLVVGGVFSLNRSFDGAAIYVGGGSSAEIRQARFEDNSAEDDGGAIVSHGTLLSVHECTFLRNKASDRGGAIIARDSLFTVTPALRLLLEGSTFESNEAREGGAVVMEFAGTHFGQPDPTQGEIRACRFMSNRATGWGGAFSNGYESGLCVLQGCYFQGNSAVSGGAISCDYDSFTHLEGCTIVENNATAYGGAVEFSDAADLAIKGSTIAGNAAGYAGGALYGHSNVVSLNESILWGNAGGSFVSPLLPFVSPLEADFSCVEQNPRIPIVLSGGGNIDSDPLFRGWDSGTVHVDASSPGPGDGTPASPFRDLKDALKGYSYVLLSSSPCLGAGEGGSNMGADTGLAAGPRIPSRLVHVAAGSYALEGAALTGNVSLVGQGAGKTVLSGENLLGLQSDATLAALTVTGGTLGGVLVGAGEAPDIQQVEATKNAGPGMSFYFGADAQVVGSTISGNARSGIWCYSSAPSMVGCAIFDNESPDNGGGLKCEGINQPTRPILQQCIVSGNVARLAGGGVFLSGSGVLTVDHSTIAGNLAGLYGGGIHSGSPARVQVTSSIVWGNGGNSILASSVLGTHSCIQGDPVWPGEGNINADPLFCAWGPNAVVHVSSASPGPGDGSPGDPFKDIQDALTGYSYALLSSSPCLGAGEGGSDMGAEQETCAKRGSPTRLVRVAEGVYDAEVFNLTPSVSIEGAGEGKTVLQGTVAGLRTGATLSSVTVTGGPEAGIFVVGQESPEIHDCAVEGNQRYGVMCTGPCSPEIRRCTVSGNISGGLRCESGAEPRVVDCAISGNLGSGVSCIGAAPRLSGCAITGNMAVEGAGLHCVDASPLLEDCIIVGNAASFGPDPFGYYELSYGGGVFSASSSAPRFERCTISGNAAMVGGGFYMPDVSRPVLENCIVWSNAGDSVFPGSGLLVASYSCIEYEAPWSGTGNTNQDPLFCGWGSAREVHVDSARPGPGDGTAGNPYREIGSALTGFSLALTAGSPCIGSGSGGKNMGADEGTCAGLGGAERIVHVARGSYSLRGLTFAQHVSLEGSGEGETVLEGTVTGLRDGAMLSRVTVTGGSAGIVIGYDSPEIRQVTIERVPDVGLRCFRSSAAIVQSTIQESTAGVQWNLGAPAFTDSTIRRNTTTGLDLTGTHGELERCVFAENGGTGIILNTAEPTLLNCLVTGNATGGIALTQGSSPILANCVIADNSNFGARGGGILCSAGFPKLYNCIVWGNIPDSIWLEGPSGLSATNCCIADSSPWPGTDNIDDDPLFIKSAKYDFNEYAEVPVGDYFLWIPDFLVEAPDYHLQPRSPAIDAGTETSAPSTDFDGNPRPGCKAVDMGIYESPECPEPPTFKRGDSNDDGKNDITDPIFTLAYLFLGGPRPGCLKSADGNDDGKLDITDPIYVLSFLFLGGPRPLDPFEACGLDATGDSLTCWTFAHCP